MTKIDIGPDAVERLARGLENVALAHHAAATLRALAAENARLRTALKNAGEFLGEEGFFRRCEDVELFLAGGKAAWLEDAGETP